MYTDAHDSQNDLSSLCPSFDTLITPQSSSLGILQTSYSSLLHTLIQHQPSQQQNQSSKSLSIYGSWFTSYTAGVLHAPSFPDSASNIYLPPAILLPIPATAQTSVTTTYGLPQSASLDLASMDALTLSLGMPRPVGHLFYNCMMCALLGALYSWGKWAYWLEPKVLRSTVKDVWLCVEVHRDAEINIFRGLAARVSSQLEPS